MTDKCQKCGAPDSSHSVHYERGVGNIRTCHICGRVGYLFISEKPNPNVMRPSRPADREWSPPRAKRALITCEGAGCKKQVRSPRRYCKACRAIRTAEQNKAAQDRYRKKLEQGAAANP